jgi:hypothetical protein
MKTIHLTQRVALWLHKLELGKNYYVAYAGGPARLCEFIKVTPKGFNFLEIQTNACVFPGHFYDSRFYKKQMPSVKQLNSIKIQIWVTNNWVIRPANSVVRYITVPVDKTQGQTA